MGRTEGEAREWGAEVYEPQTRDLAKEFLNEQGVPYDVWLLCHACGADIPEPPESRGIRFVKCPSCGEEGQVPWYSGPNDLLSDPDDDEGW